MNTLKAFKDIMQRRLFVLLSLLAWCSSALRLAGSSAPRHASSRRKLLQMAPLALLGVSSPTAADDGKIIGQIPASGIIFKDIVKVERIEDPKVQGIELYVSDFQRPITG